MEGVAAASSVIAVVGLAAQVVQGCNYLRGIFDDAKNAPQELHFLSVELRIIENIVSKIDGGEADEEYQHALDFCLEALAKLKSVVEKYTIGDLTSGRRRQWGPRLAMALNKDKLEKHMTRLREAKGHLEGIRTTAAHSALCLKTDNVQGSIVQLSHLHDERSSTMIHGINLLHYRMSEMGEAVGLIRDYCAREKSMLLGGESDKTLLKVQSIFEDVLAKTLPPPPNPEPSNYYPRLLSGDTQSCEESTVTCSRVLDSNSEETDIERNERLWRQSLPELHRKLAELTNATSADNHFDDVEFNPGWESNAKCGGPSASGEIYLRSTSSTYSSFDKMPILTGDQIFDVSSINTASPIVVTTTEILLLPKSWMQKRGFRLILRRVEQASAEIVSKIYYGIENFDQHVGKARRLDRVVHPDGIVMGSKPGLLRIKEPKKKNTDSSLIVSTALKVALSATGTRKPRLVVRSSSIVSRRTTIRQSFDDEINDAMELVTLWVEGRLTVDFYQDLLDDSALKMQEQKLVKRPGPLQNSELRFHGLRVAYVQELATAIVGESQRSNESKEYDIPHQLNRIHEAYWDQFLQLTSFWFSSAPMYLPNRQDYFFCLNTQRIRDFHGLKYKILYLQSLYREIRYYREVLHEGRRRILRAVKLGIRDSLMEKSEEIHSPGVSNTAQVQNITHISYLPPTRSFPFDTLAAFEVAEIWSSLEKEHVTRERLLQLSRNKTMLDYLVDFYSNFNYKE